MKTLYSYILIFSFLIITANTICAEITLPAIVSSNMVLQRNTTITIWGWADEQEEVSITASWHKTTVVTQADTDGNWSITIETNDSREAQTINIKSKTSDITLDNILLGEVWLCSGQSNMQQAVRGYTGQPTIGSNMAIATSSNSNLRLFTVERNGSKTPLQELKGFTAWQEATPGSVASFSAVAYFYGNQLQEILNVPVGLIHTSWGASTVQAWMSIEALNKHQKINLDSIDINEKPNRTPTALFNAMINPIIPYTIKGALWYQGESNRNEPELYKVLFPAMVEDWRERWAIGDFPFYYAQIAPFKYGKDSSAYHTTKNTAYMREAQLECLDLIPNSGIAITMDIGDYNGIHPPKKKEVADRLLFNALHLSYGLSSVDHAAPILDGTEVKNGGLLLKFKNNEHGLYSYQPLEGFEIAGADRIFYPATAKIVNRKNILVKSDKVPKPEAARYGWSNWVEGTLFDNSLLPASSFRTDDWDDARQAEK